MYEYGPLICRLGTHFLAQLFYTKCAVPYSYFLAAQFRLHFWARHNFNLVGCTAETVFEDAIEFVCSSHLMLVVGLAATAANVSLGPLAETGHDLLDATAGILTIVTF